MNKIASGQEGNVYLTNNRKIIKHRLINTDDKEFRIQQILYQVIPKNIIRPIDQFRTLNGNPIFLMEYLRAKTFKEIISDPKSFQDFPTILIRLLCKVMIALDKIHKAHPSFRHNDLHGDNILITDEQEVFITDFGKSTMDIPGVDHLSIYEDFGIVPRNDQRYDYHLFINTAYTLGPPKLRKIIEMVMPLEYLGVETEYIKNFRLRPDIKHEKLPSRLKLVKIFCVK